MTNRCEDYPCCGHTDGLGCNYTPDYSNPHFLCDHESGICEVDEMWAEIMNEEDDDGGYIPFLDDGLTDADYIRWEQEAQLDQMEANMGIEPRGWEDSY
jgi:hypothetical protein